MFLLSFVVEKSFIVNIIEKSEFWLNLAVNVCFTALFIVSFFSKNLKHAGKKIFFCVAVLSFVPLTYKLLFLKAMTVTDAKVLFFKSVVFFLEYCLLSVHGEYPCSENCAPKNNESSTFSTPVQVPHTPMYAQPTHSTMQTTLPPAPQSANYTPYSPYCPSSNLIPFSPLAVPPAPDPIRSAGQSSFPAALFFSAFAVPFVSSLFILYAILFLKYGKPFPEHFPLFQFYKHIITILYQSTCALSRLF